MTRRISGSDWREAVSSRRERTSSAEHFFSAPSTYALVRSTFVLTRTEGGAWALRAWGRVERESIDELVETLDALSAVPERRQLFDLRRIETYSADAMRAVVDFYASHPRYAATIAREAVVRPDGLVGVFAEGLFRALKVPFPGIVVTDEAEALAFLGEPWGALAIAGWEPSAGGSDLVWRVRAVVMRRGAGVQLAETARELGLSERSLQRELTSVGSSFRVVRREVLADEIDRLRSMGHSLKEIATRLGFGRLARLSELYRGVRGHAPRDAPANR